MDSIVRIVASVTRAGKHATICYDVVGPIAAITFPDLAPPARRDELWKATCFELFVQVPGEDGYIEWNFAPSGEWAAYRFDGYRAGMRNADVATPVISTEVSGNLFRMSVTAELGDQPLRAGLSAVIRDVDGNTSYWALAHPAGKADFHHTDGFVLELAPLR